MPILTLSFSDSSDDPEIVEISVNLEPPPSPLQPLSAAQNLGLYLLDVAADVISPARFSGTGKRIVKLSRSSCDSCRRGFCRIHGAP